jgi:hypothetical protein
MDFEIWLKNNPIPPEMYYKGGALAQFEVFRKFAQILGGPLEVASTHRSKSIVLPVIKVTTPWGLTCYARDNFHDINVSVESPRPFVTDLFGLPASGDSYLYFQGFEEAWQFPVFTMGCSRFSACLSNLEALAHALVWDHRRGLGESPVVPRDPEIRTRLAVRAMAEAAFFPMVYQKADVSCTYFLFENQEDIEPPTENLQKALTARSEYSGKKVSYLTLDFTSGCPKPVDSWLRTLDKLAAERRSDDEIERLGGNRGAQVTVTRMTPELRARAEELGCLELLKPAEKK